LLAANVAAKIRRDFEVRFLPTVKGCRKQAALRFHCRPTLF
jgi:hypothetical protein